ALAGRSRREVIAMFPAALLVCALAAAPQVGTTDPPSVSLPAINTSLHHRVVTMTMVDGTEQRASNVVLGAETSTYQDDDDDPHQVATSEISTITTLRRPYVALHIGVGALVGTAAGVAVGSSSGGSGSSYVDTEGAAVLVLGGLAA